MSMLNHFFDYKPEVLALDEKALELCQPYFKQMEDIRDYNQLKMLKAFADTQMSSTDMLGTTGYGLWDTGRAKLEQIFAEVMGAEDALVRSQFQSGTHTLAVALFGLLFTLQGFGAVQGSPMSNTTTWSVLGPIIALSIEDEVFDSDAEFAALTDEEYGECLARIPDSIGAVANYWRENPASADEQVARDPGDAPTPPRRRGGRWVH